MKRYIIILSAFLGLTAGRCAAQALADVQNNFNTYTASTLQEKLFVHTDKNGYTAGELVWFKIYDVDGILMRPLNLSKVVYVEVLDDKQTPILQTKVAMKDGAGNGSLYIPVNLPGGNFILRAYTSWMKNFSPDLYFSKKLTIINPLKTPTAESKPLAASYDIQFFPEGGALVSGMTSVVGVKATDTWGKGISYKGAILNQKNDTIVRFQPFKFGIGHFNFKPESGVAYHAVVNIGGKLVQKDVPQISASGYVMGLKDDSNGQLTITVNTNLPSQTFYLFAQTRNVIRSVQEAANTNGTATFTIAADKLGEGISQLTVFNADKKPVCERLYFKRPTKTLTVDANADASLYAPRRKVDLAINIKGSDAKPSAADLSVSVYRLDSLQYVDHEDILSYLWFRADLKGFIEQPDQYLKNTDASTNQALNDLLLTQGWRKFNWDDVVEGKPAVLTFAPEFNGPIINGRITDLRTGQPANAITAYLSIPGKSVQLYAAQSNARGGLNFSMKNFYGNTEMVAETNTLIDTNYRIDILSPFSEQYAQLSVPPLTVTPSMRSTFDEQALNMQVQNIYNGSKMRLFDNARTDSSAFYGTPYRSYLLDNYTRFTTLEEVMREYVKEVNIFHTHDLFRIRFLSGLGFLDDHDPLVMVDGVPTFNMNKVFAVSALKIRKLDDVPFKYSLGPSYESGIISLTSYKGDRAGLEIDPHAVVLDYEGLQQQRQFYSPVYGTDEQVASHLPDFRNVLYWSPSVSTDASGKAQVSFYTGDQPGKYIGVVQGITANGDAGSRTFSFEVKPNYSSQVK